MLAFEQQAQEVARLIIKIRKQPLNLERVKRLGFTPEQMRLIMLLPSTASDDRVQLQITRKDLIRLKRLVNIHVQLQSNRGAMLFAVFAYVAKGEWTGVNKIVDMFYQDLHDKIGMEIYPKTKLIRGNNDLGEFLTHYLHVGMALAFDNPIPKGAPEIDPGGWMEYKEFLHALMRVGPLLGLNGAALNLFRRDLKAAYTGRYKMTTVFIDPSQEARQAMAGWTVENMSPAPQRGYFAGCAPSQTTPDFTVKL